MAKNSFLAEVTFKDKNAWKSFIRNRITHGSMENRHWNKYDDDNDKKPRISCLQWNFEIDISMILTTQFNCFPYIPCSPPPSVPHIPCSPPPTPLPLQVLKELGGEKIKIPPLLVTPRSTLSLRTFLIFITVAFHGIETVLLPFTIHC